MATYSDESIKAEIENDSIVIYPYDESNVEPASVDLRLGSGMKIVNREYQYKPIDLRNGDDSALLYEELENDDGYLIYPGQLYLGTTKEYIEIPDNVSASVLGRSSLGRIGLSVHQTAGYIDPGFKGEITLELVNHGPSPIRVRPGDRICQIVFHELTQPAQQPYGHENSQYQGQRGATPSGMKFD